MAPSSTFNVLITDLGLHFYFETVVLFTNDQKRSSRASWYKDERRRLAQDRAGRHSARLEISRQQAAKRAPNERRHFLTPDSTSQD